MKWNILRKFVSDHNFKETERKQTRQENPSQISRYKCSLNAEEKEQFCHCEFTCEQSIGEDWINNINKMFNVPEMERKREKEGE